MTRTLAFFDRLLTFILGLGLIVVGVIPAAMYWNIPYVSEWFNSLNRSSLSGAHDEPWFVYALAIGFIICLVLGLWIVLANIRSRGISWRDTTSADSEHGHTTVHVQHLAQAACDYMASSPLVDHAEQSVTMVRDRPTVTFTVTTTPEHSLRDCVAFVEGADKQFTQALGSMDIDTVFRLQLDRISE